MPVGVAFTTSPQVVAVGRCSDAVTVQARDAFDNPANVAAATPVQLFATPARSVTFDTRADCAGRAITSAEIPAGDNRVSFYFKGQRQRAVTIAAALGTGGASQDEVITPPAGPPRSRAPQR